MKSVIVIQGEDLVKEYEQSDNKIQFVLNNYTISEDGNIIVKEFETEKEKQAYLQGFEDGDGWNKNHFIANERADEIAHLIKNSRIYVVRENFYQENMPSNCEFKIFAGEKAYERAIFFLEESANARDSFVEFLKEEGDFRTKDLVWEIDEQTLQMWSAESMNVLDNIRELGKYAEKYSELVYKEREIDYGVRGYYFEDKYV
ncbi:MAG: hypothetical protein AAB336_13630 [Acidobacteriota bacterium]